MLVKYLQYRYVKARMNAYLDGELPAKTRRFIARQIDENPLCYNDYLRAKQTKQELERSLPTFGKAEAGQLNHLWANIQAELNQPEQKSSSPHHPRYSLSYGVAMLILAIIMLAPFAIDASRATVSPVPQHPLPEETALLTSPASTPDAHPRVIAFAVDTAVVQAQSTDGSSIPLQNTPAPRTPGR